jgi:hypothetical protein
MANGRGGDALKTTPRLISAQSVVNIAGYKYLVVPHPDAAAEKHKKNQPKTTLANSPRLPLLLTPAEPGSMPSFEVEEVEGKLILVPRDTHIRNPFVKDKESGGTNQVFLNGCLSKCSIRS